MALPILATQEDLNYAAQKQREMFVEKEADKSLVSNTEKAAWNAAKTHAESTHAPSNAQANQNAFSNVKVGAATIAADTATDTLEIVAGSNVTLTPDATNDKLTIAVTVPTKLGELTNDKSYQTQAEVQTAINAAVAGVYKIKGSIAFASLPTTGMVAGDTYNITNAFTTDTKFTEGSGKSYPAGTNVVYTTDSKWDCMAGVYDLSVFIKASDLVQMTKADIDAMYA